jgi:HD-like signal output (HDOD) protein
MARSPQELVKGDVNISSLPMVAMKLNDVMNNPRSSAIDIGKVVGEDQGLTARLLKLANSPFYAFPSRIETITQAVLVIGTQQIRDLVLATSVMKMFEGIPAEIINMESFWSHCIACGVAARIIAIYRREPNVERFFVAGMLHDLGRLIMFTKMPKESKEILTLCKENKEALFKAERERIGFNHADVGGALLKEWRLPGSLVEMAEFHHNPGRAVQFPTETAIIHVADIITHAMQIGGSGESFVPPLSENAWDKIKLPAATLTSVMEQTDKQFAEAVKFIGQ